jgi:hypothetical protein
VRYSEGAHERASDATAGKAGTERYGGCVASAEREIVKDSGELCERAARAIGRSERGGECKGRRRGPCGTRDARLLTSAAAAAAG